MFALFRWCNIGPHLALGQAALCLCWVGIAQGGGPEDPAVTWSETTWSPHARDGRSPIEPPLAAVCPRADGALLSVAADIAGRERTAPDAETLAWSLRAAGSPYVWPRALVLSARQIDPAAAASRLGAWLGTEPGRGQRRCGIAMAHRRDGTEVLTAVAVDAEADMDPLPVRTRVGGWITVNARALVPATGAKLVVLGPSGPPRSVPTSFAHGRVIARANLDREGAWVVQLLLSTGIGPHPVLEANVFAGVDPPATPLALPAPGESEAPVTDNPAGRLFEMMNGARASEGLAWLRWDRELHRAAEKHARRMLDARRLGHDVGDGDPAQRVESSGIPAREVGENVAHAENPSMAHRAIWASPSHRANLLERRFGRAGVGVATDTDGSVWVACLFASDR